MTIESPEHKSGCAKMRANLESWEVIDERAQVADEESGATGIEQDRSEFR